MSMYTLYKTAAQLRQILFYNRIIKSLRYCIVLSWYLGISMYYFITVSFHCIIETTECVSCYDPIVCVL